ncbi:hypothetical protein SCHPADRAFT_938213 [Schizopora paradoxa]|uniref:Uncharacterized protein n=1 Tax=Schizopora paradoxa TaxID=27342 RepID=A0A0H2RW29_9AGAM|nr:hypothetical protein SCHPADRAFT_938213 [Schizopora paradoxa]
MTTTASTALESPTIQQSVSTTFTLPSPLSRSTSTPPTLPLKSSPSDHKFIGGVLGAVGLIILAVFVALTIWLKRRRRLRRAGSHGDEPPQYDTTVTPFVMHANEGARRMGLVSIVARLFNRIKRLEQTERLRGTDDGRTQSDTATLSDPPPYSERPGISEAATGARTVSSIPNGQLGQSSPRHDRKHLGRNGH